MLEKPDYDLDLMRPGQTLSGLTARVFTELDPVLAHEQPDWVLVQGDTTTVMAASLVAFYHQVKVGLWKPACAPSINGSRSPKK